MIFRKFGKIAVVCIGFLLDFAHLLNKIFTLEKINKLIFFSLTQIFRISGYAENTHARK